MGVTFDQLAHVFKAVLVFLSMLFLFAKFGGTTDPSTIEVGSPEWYTYVKQFQTYYC